MDSQEAFDHWFDDDVEQDVADASGGDWDDLVDLVKDAFKAVYAAHFDAMMEDTYG